MMWIGGAVLYAKDLTRLQDFYRATLDVEPSSVGNGHVVFGSTAFRFVIVQAPAHIASSIVLDDPPHLRAESPIKPILPTRSIATARVAAREHGGNVQPAEREWDFEGSRVCDGSDPEGNVIQFREVRAQPPEW